MKKKIYSIGGPCAVGKDTLARTLIQQFPRQILRFPRTTTRPPRLNEKHGREYFFLAPEEFQRKQDAGIIVAVDNCGVAEYGIDLIQLQEIVNNGNPEKILIVGGICGIGLKKFFPDMMNIYIMAEISELKRRLYQRGHRGEDFHRRVEWMHRQIIQEPPLFDIVVRNPDGKLHETVKILKSILDLENLL